MGRTPPEPLAAGTARRGPALFKFGERVHMEDLVANGHLFMRAPSDFARMEQDELRYDPYEGSGAVLFLPGGEIAADLNGEWVTLGTLVSPLVQRDPALENVNVFCMFGLIGTTADQLVHERNLGFGDTYVVFLDPNEFLRRVEAEVRRRGLSAQSAQVEYVDESTYTGEMGVFRKFSRFQYQSEYRIALYPGTGKPYSLHVGDLSDIAALGPLEELNRRLRINPASA